jgi:hypothetical protein
MQLFIGKCKRNTVLEYYIARDTEVARSMYVVRSRVVDDVGLPARCAVENGPLRCGATDGNHGSIDGQTTSAGGA